QQSPLREPERAVTGHVGVVDDDLDLLGGTVFPERMGEAIAGYRLHARERVAYERREFVAERRYELVASRARGLGRSGRRPSGWVAERCEPHQVVVVRVGGEAADDGESERVDRRGQADEFVRVPGGVDQQGPCSVGHDRAGRAEVAAGGNPDAVGDLRERTWWGHRELLRHEDS